jgi:UDP-N-acetylmuramoyl-L-alanyl-D-glutamate--2,6-diaminopimelate ligase
METLLRTVKKLIPARLFRMLQPAYHFTLVFLGALRYWFPSRNIYCIGVTGTKGKSSTVEFINAILEADGKTTAVSGTIRFKLGARSEPNLYKMSVPGRFFLQRFLRRAVHGGCEYAVLELTSEAVKQYRHKFISLNALVFTNLAPEHIESHGSFEQYAAAKLQLVTALERSGKRNRAVVANVDDAFGKKFLAANVEHRLPYSLADGEPIELSASGSIFLFHGKRITTNLPGRFNVYNMLAAATLCSFMGVSDETIARALSSMSGIKGRVERIEAGQSFPVIVDYAHTKESLVELYDAFKEKEKICVLGNTGGGRDRWKRPEMAKIADQCCAHCILTNEDPYDEDPREIVREMEAGFRNHTPEIIMDRREAIRRALSYAMERPESAVLITGKGTDPFIMGKDGSKIPWNDAEVALRELEALLGTNHERQ